MEISKELLSEVLKEEVNESIILDGSLAKYSYKYLGYAEINVYELAHKCKEWAFKQKHGYIILSGFTNLTDNIYEATIENPKTTGIYREIFCADTEPEAIFKACEWILKEIKK